MREFVEIACYFIFAMMWNLLAGYGGMVSIGQQAFFGFGGYVMLVLGNFARRQPVRRGAARRAGGGADRGAGVVRRVPPRRRLLRDRHLGHRRGVPAQHRQHLGGRRRLGHQPDRAARHREGDAREHDVLAGARLRGRFDRAGLPVPAQQARPGAARDPRQRGRRRVAGHRRARHEARGLRGRRVRLRAGGRALLRRQPAHQPGRRLQRQLDARSRSSWS